MGSGAASLGRTVSCGWRISLPHYPSTRRCRHAGRDRDCRHVVLGSADNHMSLATAPHRIPTPSASRHLEPRIVGLRQRLSQLQERHQAAHEAAETERDLALVISRLEDFSARWPQRSTLWTESACRTSFEPSYVGSKSTTAASRSSSGSRTNTGTKITSQNNQFLATLYRR